MLYSIDKEGSVIAKNNREKSVQNSRTISLTKNDNVIKQVSTFSRQVIDQLAKENIPATPENYAIYFEKLLEEKPARQRDAIQKVVSAQHVEQHNYVAEVENNIKESFRQIKVILETVSGMYNKINRLTTLTRQKQEEIANGAGKVALISYEESLQETSEILQKQQKKIKEHYSEIAEKIKFFHANTIFDPKYNVYNRNYLFRVIESEKKNIATFGHESCLLAFKVNPAALAAIRLQRDRELVTKNIATMILRRSRRSDIVAHLGNDIFIILLKHTTLPQAERVIDSIDQMIGYTNFIIESQNIEISLEYASARIVTHRTREQMLSELINQLH